MIVAIALAAFSCASSTTLCASERPANDVLVFERKLLPPRQAGSTTKVASLMPWSTDAERDSLLCGSVGNALSRIDATTTPGMNWLGKNINQRGSDWWTMACDSTLLGVDTFRVVIRWRWSRTGRATGPLAVVRTVDDPEPRQWYRGYPEYLDAAQPVKTQDVPGLVLRGEDVFSRGVHHLDVDLTVFEYPFVRMARRVGTSSTECWRGPKQLAQMIVAESLADLEQLVATPELAAKSARRSSDSDYAFASQRMFRCTEVGDRAESVKANSR
ncbi:MAG: hypothetical protein HOP12_15800 [Candidatus Eisenbacteria bacterium]|uniref:Uncharacterized protein n=1 Tax=Eiseniibacteriota bacterium TaxID=2212470 RepID=A0A849T2V3_UNCEI|nr:hypothetical protein [Candidatus Eisenbacteria bacterium]